MQHFPIFIALRDRPVILSGGGEAALAKLRLLLKSEAAITVHAPNPAPDIIDWASKGLLTLHRHPLPAGGTRGAALFYAADEDVDTDAKTAAIARADGTPVNIVDNLEGSDFITPAIVDRDPVTIAIGTEGTAPVLARAIKSELEARLPAHLGVLARAAKSFRRFAEALPMGRARRAFWSEFFDQTGPAALDSGEKLSRTLSAQLDRHLTLPEEAGRISFAVVASGDPELLPLKTRNALHNADQVRHAARIAPAVLELARREAVFGPLTNQAQPLIDAALIGQHLVYLTTCAPDPHLIAACRARGVATHVIPGIAPLADLTLLKETA